MFLLVISGRAPTRQRVYGVTWALVRVGYAYSNCDQIIWNAQTTQVSGHEMSISDIGGWDLSIHHRYNFHEGEFYPSHFIELLGKKLKLFAYKY